MPGTKYILTEKKLSVDSWKLLFLQELDFWGIYETEIEACCWGEYSKFLDHRETLANLDSTFGGAQLENKDMQQLSKLRKFQMIVWNNLEYPSYSRGAKVFNSPYLLSNNQITE